MKSLCYELTWREIALLRMSPFTCVTAVNECPQFIAYFCFIRGNFDGLSKRLKVHNWVCTYLKCSLLNIWSTSFRCWIVGGLDHQEFQRYASPCPDNSGSAPTVQCRFVEFDPSAYNCLWNGWAAHLGGTVDSSRSRVCLSVKPTGLMSFPDDGSLSSFTPCLRGYFGPFWPILGRRGIGTQQEPGTGWTENRKGLCVPKYFNEFLIFSFA